MYMHIYGLADVWHLFKSATLSTVCHCCWARYAGNMYSALFVVCVMFGFACCLDSNDVLRRGPQEFKVYWNSPTFQCASHKVTFSEVAEKYGIVMNNGDTFRGNQMVIMYDPGYFPALLEESGSSSFFFRNGGVPQSGNLSLHLEYFQKHVNEQIPDVDFNGVGVIDFESWRPIFRQNFGTLLPYKDISKDLERQTHPLWTNGMIDAEATKRFEKYARIFMEETIKKVKELRPKARWGYYAYPYCFNMNNNKQPSCGSEVMKENDRISWLWNEMDNYYPSLYMAKDTLTSKQKQQMIQGRLDEATRLAKDSNDPFEKRILPYFWYRYRDVDQFLSKDDLYNSITTLKSSGIDGVILWGSSNDVNTKTKCVSLQKYIENVLGPVLIST